LSYLFTFQIDYADTDAMGILYHGNYFRYFERARLTWLKDALNICYADLERSQRALPLYHSEVSYKKPIYFGESLKIHVTIKQLRKAALILAYEVIDADNFVRCCATTSHSLCAKSIDLNGQVKWSPVRIPEEWRTKCLEFLKQ